MHKNYQFITWLTTGLLQLGMIAQVITGAIPTQAEVRAP
jgi:hypothetical protein